MSRHSVTHHGEKKTWRAVNNSATTNQPTKTSSEPFTFTFRPRDERDDAVVADVLQRVQNGARVLLQLQELKGGWEGGRSGWRGEGETTRE